MSGRDATSHPMPADPVPLSHLDLDLAAPVTGWAAELKRRGVPIELDDLGRPSISRAAARDLFAERRESEARAARQRAEAERRAAEAAQVPRGVPLDAVPEGVSPGQWMMLNDPMNQRTRRESVLDHALAGGGITFHPIGGES